MIIGSTSQAYSSAFFRRDKPWKSGKSEPEFDADCTDVNAYFWASTAYSPMLEDCKKLTARVRSFL